MLSIILVCISQKGPTLDRDYMRCELCDGGGRRKFSGKGLLLYYSIVACRTNVKRKKVNYKKIATWFVVRNEIGFLEA